MAGTQVMGMLGAVLAGRRVPAGDVLGLIERREPEGLYLEYKRGLWLGQAKSPGHELREYTSAFANAEGGLLVVGIVGGEDAQKGQKWTIEGPTCPDQAAGWEDWLGQVLEEIAARTRVRWQVVSIGSQDVVLVGVDRAEALIKVYEKPDLVCYLRIGALTIPIDDTLFADLALGRRANPDLALKISKAYGGVDSLGYYVNLSLTVSNHGLLWVPDCKVALVGYSRLGGSTLMGRAPSVPASDSLVRHLDVRPMDPARGDVDVAVTDLSRAPTPNGSRTELRPFESAEFGIRLDNLPVPAEHLEWAWAAAILALPKQAGPLWAQLAISSTGRNPPFCSGWMPSAGTPPVVAFKCGGDVPTGLLSIFPGGVPRQDPPGQGRP